VLSWLRKENGDSKMKGKLITVVVGVLVAVVSWVPLWIVMARDPYAMPVALGLLTFAASFVGGVIASVGVVRLTIDALRASKARS
jgi:peptidoglycan/LPS O-acetylase OafA/YrhL